jgi:ribosomal-protein-alanine acetyltransferase
VRKLRPTDIIVIQHILARAPEAAFWSLQAIDDILRQSWASAFVSERADAVTGFVVGKRVMDEGEVLNLAVDANRRRRGDGQALVRRLLTEFREHQVKRVFLEVRESNLGAIQLYEQLSFVRVGQRENYYRDPTEAALILEKKFEIHRLGTDYPLTP